MVKVREQYETIEGFGCTYRRSTRTWYLLGLPIWRAVVTRRC